jgi:cell division protein FtsL
MPALYVIAFFGVVVSCAVLIIWNTLQVNRLTSERNKLDDQIAQTTQRLIRLRADEMQLSAQSRVRQIAQDKLGMTEVTPEDVVVAH